MKKERKMLPKKDRPVGLYLWCNKHKQQYSSDNVIKNKCKSCELNYRAKIHIPGLGDKCKIKRLYANDFGQAVQMLLEYRKELVSNNYQNFSISEEIIKPVYLLDCMNTFMDYKKDIGVPFHLKKNLPRENWTKAQLYLNYFNYALKQNDLEPNLLKFTDINSKIVGMVTEYLLSPERKSSNKTFNNAIANIKSFMKHIIDHHYRDFDNPFSKVPKLPVKKNNVIVTKEEFMKVINLTKPENLIKIQKSGKRDNFYTPWLIDGFYLGLFSGGRTEEPVHMRWSDIVLNENGQMSVIKVIDLKRTRASSSLGEKMEIVKTVEMTPELEDFLIEMGYDEKKDSTEYILAPNSQISRKIMAIKISEAFNFLISQLELKEKKQFKNLRKTYATKCKIENPETFYLNMGHTNPNTTLNYYIDMDYVMEQRRIALYQQRALEVEKINSLNEKKQEGNG